MISRKRPTYQPGFLEVAGASIERYRELGLEESRCTIAGIAKATYGASFATATRRILGGESRRCPEWLILGWTAISFLSYETVRAKVEADGFTVVDRKNQLDRDGKGAANLARGWLKRLPDGRFVYDLAKYEADCKADYEAELARGSESNR